jgi:hypothetical protein
VYDLVTGKRILYKLFAATQDNRQFNPNDRHDVFRRLAHLGVKLLMDAEAIPAAQVFLEPFVAFVRQPPVPTILQRVGRGVQHDVLIDGVPFVEIHGSPKPYGYEIIYDLRSAYEIGRIIVHSPSKTIFVPGTEVFSDEHIQGQTTDGAVAIAPLHECWVVPKMVFCGTRALEATFPFYRRQ